MGNLVTSAFVVVSCCFILCGFGLAALLLSEWSIMADETNCSTMADLRWWQMSDGLRWWICGLRWQGLVHFTGGITAPRPCMTGLQLCQMENDDEWGIIFLGKPTCEVIQCNLPFEEWDCNEISPALLALSGPNQVPASVGFHGTSVRHGWGVNPVKPETTILNNTKYTKWVPSGKLT